jgi:hypothetical protein
MVSDQDQLEPISKRHVYSFCDYPRTNKEVQRGFGRSNIGYSLGEFVCDLRPKHGNSASTLDAHRAQLLVFKR